MGVGAGTQNFKVPDGANASKKVVNEEGIPGTEITLEDIFEGTRGEDPSDSKFDIPTFLNTK